MKNLKKKILLLSLLILSFCMCCGFQYPKKIVEPLQQFKETQQTKCAEFNYKLINPFKKYIHINFDCIDDFKKPGGNSR